MINRKQEAKLILDIRRDFTTYKKFIYKRYTTAPHLNMLDDVLQQVAEYVRTDGKSGLGRVIIEMPPRHGKTLTVSKLFPTWFLGNQPTKRVMMVSYGATLAQKNSRVARNIIKFPRYQAIFGNTRLAPDSASVDAWDLDNYEGGADAMGIGGGATGKGAHVLIVDDPIKNRQEAESETMRNKVWDSFTDDLYTRLEPNGAIILMMTRWHQDDLIGRALKQMPDEGWYRLRLPALAENDDPLGRDPDSALWGKRYPTNVIKKIKTAMGDYSFSALYQQNPTPAEGGIFKRKWFSTLHNEPPQIVETVRYWDLAMSSKTSADYTVGLKLGKDIDGHFWVLDVARGQIEWADVGAFIKSRVLEDGQSVRQGIENKGYMSRAVQDLNSDPELNAYSIFGYNVDTDKLTRALPFAAKCGAGMVHLLSRHWTYDFIDEVCSFPNGAHDDQLDAASGAYEMLFSAVQLTGFSTRDVYGTAKGY